LNKKEKYPKLIRIGVNRLALEAPTVLVKRKTGENNYVKSLATTLKIRNTRSEIKVKFKRAISHR
jgi:hypothetical protein